MKWVQIIIVIVILVSLASFFAPFVGGLKYDYETYDVFKAEREYFAKYLPKSATEIHHYAVCDFDTNYHFIKATVKIKNLADLTASENSFDTPSQYTGLSYSDEQFDCLFYKRPNWWNQDELLGYEENFLGIFADDNNYGSGIWLFYDKQTQKLRLFIWSQQWLSADKVKEELNL